MTTGIQFWDTSVWSFIITMTVLFGAMMIANILRNTIRPLSRLMIPSAVLGGFLALLVNTLIKQIFGNPLFDNATMESLTYHGLGLGFVAMTLRNLEKVESSRKRDAFDAGVTVVCTYLLQAVLGLLITLALAGVINCFPASGILLPMGYGQGPGQAYNWGHNYETTYGFAHGTSFGLTVAAMGFVSASIGGVVYINRMRRQGRFQGQTGNDVTDTNLSAETITGKDEIPLSESMDKFTVQVCLVFLAYTGAYLLMKGLDAIIATGVLGNFGFNTLRPLVWGFNFLIATICALVLRTILRKLKHIGIIRREYTNNFMQSRIAGIMFDIMVVASIAAIDLSAFTVPEFVVPLLLICLGGAVATYFYLGFLCKRIYPDYVDAAFLSLYGMLTGTASTGIILLREEDPLFDTPAANNLVYHQPWAILFGFPMLLVLSFAPQGTMQAWLTLGILLTLFIAMNILQFRSLIFRSRNGAKSDKK